MNHLWVEDSFQKWCMQREGRPSYQVYAHGMSDIVGHFWIDRKTPIPADVEDIIKSSCGKDDILDLSWMKILRSPNLHILLKPLASLNTIPLSRTRTAATGSTESSKTAGYHRYSICDSVDIYAHTPLEN